MVKRSPFVVFLLTCITLGIYGIVWFAKTGGEIKAKGGDVPHWFLMLIPFINLFYMWKWCESLEKVSGGKAGGSLAFVLMFFLGPIGMAVAQSKINAL